MVYGPIRNEVTAMIKQIQMFAQEAIGVDIPVLLTALKTSDKNNFKNQIQTMVETWTVAQEKLKNVKKQQEEICARVLSLHNEVVGKEQEHANQEKSACGKKIG